MVAISRRLQTVVGTAAHHLEPEVPELSESLFEREAAGGGTALDEGKEVAYREGEGR